MRLRRTDGTCRRLSRWSGVQTWLCIVAGAFRRCAGACCGGTKDVWCCRGDGDACGCGCGRRLCAWRAREQIKPQRLGIVRDFCSGKPDTPVAALATTHALGAEVFVGVGMRFVFWCTTREESWLGYICMPLCVVSLCVYASLPGALRASVCCRVGCLGVVLPRPFPWRLGWTPPAALCLSAVAGGLLPGVFSRWWSVVEVIQGRQIRRASFLPAAITFYWAARRPWRCLWRFLDADNTGLTMPPKLLLNEASPADSGLLPAWTHVSTVH